MKILITGVQGFIGTWTLFCLKSFDTKIYGLDNKSSFGERLFDVINGSNLLEKNFNIDITQKSEVEKILIKNEFDLIIHLAGQAIVPRAFANPYETFCSNTIGTLNLLEAWKKVSKSSILICITSDKVYENNNNGKNFSENDVLGGSDIYSVSKSTCEFIVRSYARNHCDLNGKALHTLRLGNVVGGGDWSVNRLLPDLIRSYSTDKNFYLRYAKATRPFQHVLDVSMSIIALKDKIKKGLVKNYDFWNLGPKNNTYAMVGDVVNLFENKFGKLEIKSNPQKIKEDLLLSVDNKKFSKYVQSSRFDSLESISLSLNWYKKYIDGGNPVKLMEENLKFWNKKDE